MKTANTIDGLGRREHPSSHSLDVLACGEFPCRGRVEQRFVRRRSPKKIRQARRDFVSGQRPGFHAAVDRLGSI